MDVLCVREATKFAADHCRAGKVSLKTVNYNKKESEFASFSSKLYFSYLSSGSRSHGASDLPLSRTQYERSWCQVKDCSTCSISFN